MTVKIDGTNGVDTAQLRAPDGDPVAMTVGNDGKAGFSIGILGFELFLAPAGGNGSYVKFPTWLGKLAIQFGRFSFTYTGAVQTHSWTLSLPMVCYAELIARNGLLANANSVNYDQVISTAPASPISTQGNISFGATSGSSSGNVSWLLIGTY